jgi:hypothetical protein
MGTTRAREHGLRPAPVETPSEVNNERAAIEFRDKAFEGKPKKRRGMGKRFTTQYQPQARKGVIRILALAIPTALIHTPHIRFEAGIPA